MHGESLPVSNRWSVSDGGKGSTQREQTGLERRGEHGDRTMGGRPMIPRELSAGRCGEGFQPATSFPVTNVILQKDRRLLSWGFRRKGGCKKTIEPNNIVSALPHFLI